MTEKGPSDRIPLTVWEKLRLALLAASTTSEVVIAVTLVLNQPS